MRKSPLQLAALHLGLLAYVVNSAAFAWGFVQCEEPGGEVTIERAGDHSECLSQVVTVHAHGETDTTECRMCSSCPCDDTPIGVGPATSGKRGGATGRSLASAASVQAAMHSLPAVGHRAICVPSSPPMLGSLRTVVLLI